MLVSDLVMLTLIARSMSVSLRNLVNLLDVSDDSKAHYSAVLSELSEQLDLRYRDLSAHRGAH